MFHSLNSLYAPPWVVNGMITEYQRVYPQFGINYSGPPVNGNVCNKIIGYRSEYRGPNICGWAHVGGFLMVILLYNNY